jgi:hypothetical protein
MPHSSPNNLSQTKRSERSPQDNVYVFCVMSNTSPNTAQPIYTEQVPRHCVWSDSEYRRPDVHGHVSAQANDIE